MDTVSNANSTPTHLMLHRAGAANGHSTRKQGNATQSAFASYGFGPVDTHDMQGGKSTDSKPLTNQFGQAAATGSKLNTNANWIAQVQSSANVNSKTTG